MTVSPECQCRFAETTGEPRASFGSLAFFAVRYTFVQKLEQAQMAKPRRQFDEGENHGPHFVIAALFVCTITGRTFSSGTSQPENFVANPRDP